jgi:hypothetical protein
MSHYDRLYISCQRCDFREFQVYSAVILYIGIWILEMRLYLCRANRIGIWKLCMKLHWIAVQTEFVFWSSQPWFMAESA